MKKFSVLVGCIITDTERRNLKEGYFVVGGEFFVLRLGCFKEFVLP